MLDSFHFSGMDIHSCINSFIPSVQLSSIQFKSIQSCHPPSSSIRCSSVQASPIQFGSVQFNSFQYFVHSYVFILCMPSHMPFHHVPQRRITLCQSSWSWRHEIAFSWRRTFFAIVASLLWNFHPASREWYWQRARERERSGLRETTYKLVERDLAEEWSWHRWEDKKK